MATERTRIEELLSEALTRAGLQFREQVVLARGGDVCLSQFPCRCGWDEDYGWESGAEPDDCRWYQPGFRAIVPDFVIGDLVVEADGADYHQDRRKEQIRDARIMWRGYAVLHLSGAEITADPDACVALILDCLEANKREPSGG